MNSENPWKTDQIDDHYLDKSRVEARVQHGAVPVQYRDFALYGTVLYF